MLLFQGLWGNFGLMIELFSSSKAKHTTSFKMLEITTFNLHGMGENA